MQEGGCRMFAENSVGFFLQLDNQLSPELLKAKNDYQSFVKSINALNDKAVAAAGKGFSALGDLVKSFTDLPKRALAAYTTTRKMLQAKMKPLIQQVQFDFSPRSRKDFVLA